MVQVDFYHLHDLTLEDILPALLRRTLAQRAKAAIWCKKKETCASISSALWRSPYPNWLPHGLKGTHCPDLQPIWITTTEDLPNKADYLFLTENCTCPSPERFSRIFYLFDGNEADERDFAREAWIAAKKIATPLTYWKKENGRWTYRR